jgi:hypothetical protein
MLKTKRFLILVLLSFILIEGCAFGYKENKVYDELCKSQIRTAKMFFKTNEVRLVGNKAVLELNKKIVATCTSCPFSPEYLKAFEEMLVERTKSRIIKYEDTVKVAKEHVKLAKARVPVFAEIAKIYTGLGGNINNNENNNAKAEDTVTAKTIEINKENERCARLFDSQVEAIEIFLKYFERRVGLISDALKYRYEQLSKEEKSKTETANIDIDEVELEKIELNILESEFKLAEEEVEFVHACLKAAKSYNIVFEEIAKILPKTFIPEKIATVKGYDYDGFIKIGKHGLKLAKNVLRKSQDELKSLQVYVKDIENNAKSNTETIDVLKFRLKVVERQVDNNILYVKKAELPLKLLIKEAKKFNLDKKRDREIEKKLDKVRKEEAKGKHF